MFFGRKRLFCFFLLIFSVRAVATYLDLEVANGSSYKSQTLSAGGDVHHVKDRGKESQVGWSASYTHTASETTASSGGTIKDNTNDFSGGLSLDTPSLISAGGSFAFSNSPEENLLSYGPQLYIGKTIKYGGGSKVQKAKDKKQDEDLDDEELTTEESHASSFQPSFGIELGVGQTNYRQTYSTSQTRANGRIRTTAGESLISQKTATLTFKWKPWSWTTLKLSGTSYSYDKDVSQFAANLDANPVLASSGLGGLLSGFPSSSGKFSMTFYIGDNWDLLLSTSRSTAAIAQAISTANRFMLGYHFLEDWRISAGAEASKTEATSTTSEYSDTQSLFALSCDF